MDLAEVLRAHLELPKMILPHKIDYAKVGLWCVDAAVSYELGHLMVAKDARRQAEADVQDPGGCDAAHCLITGSAGPGWCRRLQSCLTSQTRTCLLWQLLCLQIALSPA